MKLYEIRQAIGSCAEVTGEDDLEIRYLLTDSRMLDVQSDDVQSTKASQTLFFAIKTDKNDGARFIPELKEKGVRAFVTGDAVQALQDLAAYVRQQFDGTVIGITGSNGKTVVKEWLYQLLKDDYTVIRSPRSYNSQIGVPLSVWQLTNVQKDDVQCTKPVLAIFEAGISQPGEMEKLERIIRPTIGVITYIGHEHDENFASLEQKREEKMKLFVHAQTVIEDPTHQNVRTCAAVMRALGYDEEVIAERILHQTHETVMEVNLSALVDNVRYFRSLLKPETKLTCMVKAFAYGAGSVEVSRALQAANVQSDNVQCTNLVDYLAVAVADEGVELRKAGITLPIIIMDPEVASMGAERLFASVAQDRDGGCRGEGFGERADSYQDRLGDAPSRVLRGRYTVVAEQTAAPENGACGVGVLALGGFGRSAVRCVHHGPDTLFRPLRRSAQSRASLSHHQAYMQLCRHRAVHGLSVRYVPLGHWAVWLLVQRSQTA